jgi:DNA-binding protein Fis
MTTKLIALTADAPGELLTMEEMECHYIRRVLHAVAGNKSHAARVLGLDRSRAACERVITGLGTGVAVL